MEHIGAFLLCGCGSDIWALVAREASEILWDGNQTFPHGDPSPSSAETRLQHRLLGLGLSGILGVRDHVSFTQAVQP